ncbi:MAG: sulfite exporter TauE/SafE family protein [Alphaproteobacteria bacterium]|nr:sulfite exporter TauE/SafE family protein [Alphaproteobacteria bacterium]
MNGFLADLDTVLVVTAIAAFFLAGIVKGIIGMGLPLTSISIMVTVLDPRTAIPLVVIPAIVTNIWQVVQGNRAIEILRRFWPIALAASLGVWVGTAILFAVNPLILVAGLGAIVAAYSLINLFAVRIRIAPRAERRYGPVVGFVSGIITGMTGSVGLPPAMFFQALGMDKDTYLRAISLIFLVSGVFLGLALISHGGFNAPVALASALLLLPALAGMRIGQLLSAILSQERFRQIVFAFLLVVGLNLIAKAM